LLDLDADISGLRGAEYNPRRIAEDDLRALVESVKTLGLVKPLIVRGDLLVAGHQRTRALRALGVTRAAVYRLSAETTVYDEIRFNQLHNGTDLDAGDEAARIEGGFDAPGWHVVDPSRLRANFRGQLAGVRDEICVLIGRYGPWGGVVASLDGEIIHAAQYALAAFLKGAPLTVHVLPDDKIAAARAALARTYGVFSYDGLERHTYIQTLAQMYRLRDGAKGNKSALYDDMAAPYALANPGLHYLDFGSGHGDYAKAMRRRGLHFHDVELFRRGSGHALDGRAIHGMVDRLIADLAAHGRYDGVLCDSVLNSVDSLDAEAAVMTTINALAKIGGKVWFSGRPRECIESNKRVTKRVDTKARRAVDFLDENGFTAIFRSGHWFYQKFHWRADIPGLCERFGLRLDRHAHGNTAWQVEATKIADLPRDAVESALRFEFDMALGERESLDRGDDVISAWRAAIGP